MVAILLLFKMYQIGHQDISLMSIIPLIFLLNILSGYILLSPARQVLHNIEIKFVLMITNVPVSGEIDTSTEKLPAYKEDFLCMPFQV